MFLVIMVKMYLVLEKGFWKGLSTRSINNFNLTIKYLHFYFIFSALDHLKPDAGISQYKHQGHVI